jgi:hypothetical protein
MDVGLVCGLVVLAFFAYLVIRSLGASGKDTLDAKRRVDERKRLARGPREGGS